MKDSKKAVRPGAENQENDPKKFDVEQFLKDHFDDPLRELPNYPTLEDRMALIEGRFNDLEVKLNDRMRALDDIDRWFRKQVQTLAADAVKEFYKQRAVADAAVESMARKEERVEFERNVERAVDEKFHAVAKELAKAIFEAVCARIQPHALKSR